MGESRPQGRSSSSLEKRRGRPLKEDVGGPGSERDFRQEVGWLEGRGQLAARDAG